MDWNIFWIAFGAIGTTIGSLITAIAVVIAVKQYREPLHKRLSIKTTYVYPYNLGFNMSMFCIDVSNTGVRPISITNIYLNIGSNKLLVNAAQVVVPGAIDSVTFPALLSPEGHVSMYLNRKNLHDFFSNAIAKGQYTQTDRVNVLVTDTTNGEHKKWSGRTVKDFILQ